MRGIITFCNDRGNYRAGAARLAMSLEEHWNHGSWLILNGEEQIGAPLHKENPYAFKIYAIEKALSMGYDEILYLDSSVFAVKDVEPAFDMIRNQGYLMQYSGHFVGQWCNDQTLKYYEYTRQEAMSMPMYGNAGMLGLDFKDPLVRLFFKKWKQAMLDGMFKGSWDDHRHDMTCGSIIAYRLDMKFEPGDQILQYAAPEDAPNNDSIIFYAQGL